MFLSVVLCFTSLVYSASAQIGAIRLVDYSTNVSKVSSTSGIVEVRYPNNEWGTICGDSYTVGWDEAHVICHQLGYSKAVSYSNTGSTTAYGRADETPITINLVSCTRFYYTITQCNIESSTCVTTDQATVECSSTRLWENYTYSGNIRLTGGQYSNEGLLEVYCNDKWGTVCDNNFDSTAAEAACRQLGYNSYFSLNQLAIQGKREQKIWLNNVNQCSGYSCLTRCSSCSSKDYNDECEHSEDVTLVCDYDESSFTPTLAYVTDTCDYFDLGGLARTIVIGIIVACVICVLILIAIIAIPLSICCCLGVGIGAAVGRRPTTTVVTSPYQPMGVKLTV